MVILVVRVTLDQVVLVVAEVPAVQEMVVQVVVLDMVVALVKDLDSYQAHYLH